MPEAVILCSNEQQIERVYGGGRLERLKKEFDVHPEVLNREMLFKQIDQFKEVKYIFSTWGMLNLSEEEISLLPSLQAVFYGAGSVQGFARPFLNKGVVVMSSWAANAVPVAEYTMAQIILASNGYWNAIKKCSSYEGRKQYRNEYPGNMDIEVALLGVGMIGKLVIEMLSFVNLKLIVFDPFLSEERAAELKVEKVSLEDAFKRGFIVSNHLANLPETVGMLKREHFESMQANSTFINTGRGATLDEPAFMEVLKARPDITALLDVTYPEPPTEDSTFYKLDNVHLTPHIAGSSGQEVWRMADFAIEEAIAFKAGKALRYGVSLEMLKTMA